jgi:Na+/H+ antiporter NhaC
MMNYDVLSFSDFLGSICSFWVTMLAMADIPPRLRSFAQTLGPLGVAVGVEYKRHGVWVFAIPAGFAAIVMFASWVRHFHSCVADSGLGKSSLEQDLKLTWKYPQGSA